MSSKKFFFPPVEPQPKSKKKDKDDDDDYKEEEEDDDDDDIIEENTTNKHLEPKSKKRKVVSTKNDDDFEYEEENAAVEENENNSKENEKLKEPAKSRARRRRRRIESTATSFNFTSPPAGIVAAPVAPPATSSSTSPDSALSNSSSTKSASNTNNSVQPPVTPTLMTKPNESTNAIEVDEEPDEEEPDEEESEEESEESRKENSWVYKFFKKKKGTKNTYKCLFPTGEGRNHPKKVEARSTSHLHTHLKTHHARVIGDIPKLAKSRKDVTKMCENVLEKELKEHNKAKTYFEKFVRRTQNTDDQTNKMEIEWFRIICMKGLPFNSMGSKEMLAFFHDFFGQIMPNRKVLSGPLLEGYFTIVNNEIKSLISKEVDSYSITCDGWTSCMMDAFLAITIHWISEDFQQKQATLGVLEVKGAHTGEKIKEVVKGVVAEYVGIDVPMAAIVIDNASNANAAADLLIEGTTSDVFNCFSHGLQLVVNIILNAYCTSIENVRDLVKHIRKSIQCSEAIVMQSGLKNLNLSLDVPTRWNSLYLMNVNFYKRHVKIKEFYDENSDFFTIKRSKLLLAWPNMTEISAIIEVLKPFDDITNECCQEAVPTISKVPGLVNKIFKHLKSKKATEPLIVISMKELLLKEMNDRFLWIITEPNLAMEAALIDPTVDTTFLEPEVKNQAWNEIKKMQVEFLKAENDPLVVAMVNAEVNFIRQQLETIAKLGKPKNALDFWKDWKHGKVLSFVVRKLLSIPATSSSSERAFSSAGFVYNEERASLDIDNAEKLIFLRENSSYAPQDIAEKIHALQQQQQQKEQQKEKEKKIKKGGKKAKE